MYNVTDLNGKNFQFSIDEIQDICYDKYISTQNEVQKSENYKEVVPVICDSQGNEIGDIKNFDISKITDSEGNGLPKAILVTLECTHSGDNRNWEVYHSDSMEKDAHTFLTPYNKPFLKNHNSYSEPLGRVEYANFQQSQIEPSRDTIVIDVKVTDSDAIQKFLDGRYNTVSIGGKAETVQCAVCGKNIFKDGRFDFCGHWKGERYKDTVAKWHYRDITYRECSVVNHPADDFAQVTRIKMLDDSSVKNSNNDDNNSNNVNNMNNDDNVNGISIKDNEDMANNIDNILNNIDNNNNVDDNNINNTQNNNSNDDNNSNVDNNVNNVNNNDNNDNDTNNNNSNNTDNNVNDNNSEENKLKLKVEELENKIASLDEDNKNLNSTIEELKNSEQSLKDELKDKSTTIETLENELIDAKQNLEKESKLAKEYKTISINLANNNKDLLIEKALLSEKGIHLTTDEMKDRKSEMLKMTAKEITNLINSNISNIKNSSTIPKIKNPGLVFDDNYTIMKNENDSSNPSNVDDKNKATSNKTNIIETIVNGLKS